MRQLINKINEYLSKDEQIEKFAGKFEIKNLPIEILDENNDNLKKNILHIIYQPNITLSQISKNYPQYTIDENQKFKFNDNIENGFLSDFKNEADIIINDLKQNEVNKKIFLEKNNDEFKELTKLVNGAYNKVGKLINTAIFLSIVENIQKKENLNDILDSEIGYYVPEEHKSFLSNKNIFFEKILLDKEYNDDFSQYIGNEIFIKKILPDICCKYVDEIYLKLNNNKEESCNKNIIDSLDNYENLKKIYKNSYIEEYFPNLDINKKENIVLHKFSNFLNNHSLSWSGFIDESYCKKAFEELDKEIDLTTQLKLLNDKSRKNKNKI